MLFVKRDELKKGMRLARPIYNKDGVLLYERNSKLTVQGIESIKNFGLIGIFILEPAEPVPPMTQADIDFERFQTMYVFSIQEELDKILQTRRFYKMPTIAANIVKSYGHIDKKINFVQNLRSKEDYLYKHSLNVAILCAMVTHKMNMRLDEQADTVQAAIVHDIGKLTVPKNIKDKDILTEEEQEAVRMAQIQGHNLIDIVFSSSPNVKRICVQAQRALESLESGEDISSKKTVRGAKVLAVAEVFDTMTAMQVEKAPDSEVAAIKHLLENPEVYDSDVVKALIRSINILAPGVSVELNTGEKALVLNANEQNILEPMLLMFGDNSIVDLSDREMFGDLEIKDIMKTMDNRHVMDINLLKQHGYKVEEPEYVAVRDEK
ncbi:MAG: HD domain-containing protein [Lachnospiraceae bacterium]|nr:HD domain-containing protein [Lachnospiraceae bacterium]